MLRIIGKDFDVDSFIAKTKLIPENKRYKGEPRIPFKAYGFLMRHSSLSFVVSNADFDEFDKQKIDAIEFLKTNMKDLKLINLTKGIDFATIDFGIYSLIDTDQRFTQSSFFPQELVKLCGELGLGLELSIYAKEMGQKRTL